MRIIHYSHLGTPNCHFPSFSISGMMSEEESYWTPFWYRAGHYSPAFSSLHSQLVLSLLSYD